MSNDPLVTGAPLGRAARITLVGGGLMVASGIFGAIIGAAFYTAGVAIAMHSFGWSIVAWGAARGALAGGIIAPLGAWLFLRRVPLGLAIPGLTLGTIAGGTAGALFPNTQLGPTLTPVAAAVGFAVVALMLRARPAPKPTEPESEV